MFDVLPRRRLSAIDEMHDIGVGVELNKVVDVPLRELTKHQTFGLEVVDTHDAIISRQRRAPRPAT